ncbi:MAG: class I SAM-dependent methyltransferase [Candidatus Scalindua sp.]|nr:class I SAM-dependent methyltransferase [Candidatus Scalindua sp.]
MKDLFNITFDFGCNEVSAHLKDQLALRPQDFNLMYKLANCMGNEKRYNEAEDVFVQVAQQSKKSDIKFMARFRAGISSLLDKKLVKALEHFQQAGIIDKHNHELHIFIGICYFQLGIKWLANIHWWASMKIKETATNINLVNLFMKNDDIHPERCALYPLCQGKGIDVGCGHRKTHPDAIGVDLTLKGAVGSVGNVAGTISQADIQTSGDRLDMFKDGEMDYLVQRHNLEHYQDVIKTLQEWKRVVKPGGILGMVIPDDEYCNTIKLDPTHLHVFTKSSFKRFIELIGGLKILYMDVLLKNWSFVCVLQKVDGFQKGRLPPKYDYENLMLKYEIEASLEQARVYEKEGHEVMANECYAFAEKKGAKPVLVG